MNTFLPRAAHSLRLAFQLTAMSSPTEARFTDEGAVAPLMDQARDTLVETRARGQHPTRVVLSPSAYAAVAATKRREILRGMRLCLLGLYVEQSAELSGTELFMR